MFIQFLLNCACPPDAEIPDIPVDNCEEYIGQVQKFGVQRTKDDAGAINWITLSSTNPELLATWTNLKSQTDSTKVQFSPFLEEPGGEPGEARTYGGGNQTLGGTVRILGRNATTFTGAFLNVSQSIIKELKKYECEKGLSVFLINEFDQIICLGDKQSTVLKVRGIPIRSFFVGDKGMGHYENPDKNMLSWSFFPNWSDELYFINPTDFSPTTQLS